MTLHYAFTLLGIFYIAAGLGTLTWLYRYERNVPDTAKLDREVLPATARPGCNYCINGRIRVISGQRYNHHTHSLEHTYGWQSCPKCNRGVVGP